MSIRFHLFSDNKTNAIWSLQVKRSLLILSTWRLYKELFSFCSVIKLNSSNLINGKNKAWAQNVHTKRTLRVFSALKIWARQQSRMYGWIWLIQKPTSNKYKLLLSSCSVHKLVVHVCLSWRNVNNVFSSALFIYSFISTNLYSFAITLTGFDGDENAILYTDSWIYNALSTVFRLIGNSTLSYTVHCT